MQHQHAAGQPYKMCKATESAQQTINSHTPSFGTASFNRTVMPNLKQCTVKCACASAASRDHSQSNRPQSYCRTHLLLDCLLQLIPAPHAEADAVTCCCTGAPAATRLKALPACSTHTGYQSINQLSLLKHCRACTPQNLHACSASNTLQPHITSDGPKHCQAPNSHLHGCICTRLPPSPFAHFAARLLRSSSSGMYLSIAL
jgi:hypothetical protein